MGTGGGKQGARFYRVVEADRDVCVLGGARKYYGRQYRDRYFKNLSFENDRDPFLDF
jgi:hypothetical protein